MIKLRKKIAILLAVLFIVTLTAGSVGALGNQLLDTVKSNVLQNTQLAPIRDSTSLQVGPMGSTPFPTISDAFRPSNKDGLQTGGGIKITSTSTKNIGNNINQ